MRASRLITLQFLVVQEPTDVLVLWRFKPLDELLQIEEDLFETSAKNIASRVTKT